MKIIPYAIFALFFHLYSLFPVNQQKATFIMTHDQDMSGNIGYVLNKLKKDRMFNDYNFITREDYAVTFTLRGLFRLLHFFIVKSFHMATSQSIFLDNVFLPFSMMKIKPSVFVVQLWHGSGAIKKFGQDSNKGLLQTLEKRSNNQTTHLIVNSQSVKDIYSSAFGIPQYKIYPTGSPRTDYFSDNEDLDSLKDEFLKKHREYINKKIILYAPTFRDHEVKQPSIPIDFIKLKKQLGDEYIFFIKLHPFVAKYIQKNTLTSDMIIIPSSMPMNELLVISDILITDYSSIIFEYSLLNKPMIFYPYDYDYFETKGRGFYFNYKEFVPGPIAMNEIELVNILRERLYDSSYSVEFKKTHFDFFDGKSTERVVDLLYNASPSKGVNQ